MKDQYVEVLLGEMWSVWENINIEIQGSTFISCPASKIDPFLAFPQGSSTSAHHPPAVFPSLEASEREQDGE